MGRSLRAHLLAWLVLPLLLVVAVNLVEAWLRATETATLVTDQLLLASARVIAEQVHDVDGHIDIAIPPAALEMFASPHQDKIIYQVISPSGELVAGYPDAPSAAAGRAAAQPAGFDGRFRTVPVRVLALTQPVVAHARPATVIVATTFRARDGMRYGLWLTAVRDQVLMVALAGGLIVLGLWRGLIPLRRLCQEVMTRDALSLKPVALDRVQAELRPLLAALNHALGRVDQHVSLQRRFLTNAAHQLRTPLAVLKTQASVGLREPELAGKNEALAAMDASIDGLARVMNQLLMLARAEPGGNILRAVQDAAVPTRTALEQLAIVALDRDIDLTLQAEDRPMPVDGHATLLQEMVTNLVSNALDNTPRGGQVEVSLTPQEGWAVWVFRDTGPGIPADERLRVFERFYRLPGARPGGTGLGLAIVKEIVQAHGGVMELAERVPPPGLLVRVGLPLATTGPS